MHKILLITRYEYVRHVRRRSFLLTAFGVPLLIAAVLGIIILVATRTYTEQRLGMVDLTGRFSTVDIATLDMDDPIPLEQFTSADAASAALERGAIDAYVVIPEDYVASGDVQAFGHRRLSNTAEREVRNVLRAGLLADVKLEDRARITEPVELVLRTLDGGRELSANNGLLFLMPYAFGMLFIMTTFSTSGYLLQALTEEKEGRVMEILATTLTPREMMAGKILGLSGVGLTQVGIWIGLVATAVLALVRDLSWLSEISLPLPLLGLAVVYFVLGYVLIATCYAIVGAMVTTAQEAQPFVAPISLIAIAPLMLVTVILARPNGALAVIFSLIPLSSAMTMLMRLPLADVPVWQIAVSLLTLLLSAFGALALSGHVLRLGMLRYGQRVSLREIFGRGSHA